MCEPAVLHHVAGHHEAFRRSFAHHAASRLWYKKKRQSVFCVHSPARASAALSVRPCSHYAEPEILFEVSRGKVFTPAPNVDSAVIQLRIRKEPPVDVHDEVLFFRVIRAAFAQRRKTAVNSISNTLHMSKQQVTDAFEQAGVRQIPAPKHSRCRSLPLLSINLPIKEMLL